MPRDKNEAVQEFRKKPVVIEATQWFRDGDHPKVVPIPEKYKNFNPVREGATGYITTLEGGHFVTSGDWIIKGVQGEFYPCKPDVFEQTYEPASMPKDEELLAPEEASRAFYSADKTTGSMNVAKAQLAHCKPIIEARERERIIRWGVEPCPHWAGVTVKVMKRDCGLCWQALK